MGSLANKLAYLKETVAILKENLSKVTGGSSYDGWGLRDIAYRIGQIDMYHSPYEHLPVGKHTDPFGEYDITNSYNAICIKAACANREFDTVPCIPDGGYYDFSHNGVTRFGLRYTVSGTQYSGMLNCPGCVIFPDTVTQVSMLVFNEVMCLNRGIYLPRKCDSPSPGWITVYHTNANGALTNVGGVYNYRDVAVKCPKDTETRNIYLSSLSMSATTMVGLFNNLKDVSSESATYRIQVGSTNLAKLSAAQKNIAINKGWILS